MVLFIDNYDSFTYNLVQYTGEITSDLKVVRNDRFNLEDIAEMKPSHIIVSPGPGNPENEGEVGLSVEVIKRYYKDFPILGVCLGHQSIGYALGGRVVGAPTIMHGKLSKIIHNGKGVFTNIPSPFTATRYHSLVVDKDSLPSCLEISAHTEDNIIMGISHKEYPVFGVQFHPESIASEYGKTLIANFLNI